jgi:protein-S-isoprenylcysteine O-methyltransferase Ste14
MKSLELVVPPPAVAAITAVAMWGVSLGTRAFLLPSSVRLSVFVVLLLAGLTFSLSGVLFFRRAGTTVNPTKPENASSLVRTGVYGVTRNPMYVGLSLVLLAWAVFLASPWALIGVLGFVLYISHFQIAPEERALAKLFGTEYSEYQSKVRRWL